MLDLALEREGLTKISTVDLAMLKSATLKELTAAGQLPHSPAGMPSIMWRIIATASV